jgi:hypothetical protein
MMHKIILQIFKNCKNHKILNSKLMDCTFDFHVYMDYVTIHWLLFLCELCYIHWLMLHPSTDGVCVKDFELIRYYIKKHKNKINYELNLKTILMDFWMG